LATGSVINKVTGNNMKKTIIAFAAFALANAILAEDTRIVITNSPASFILGQTVSAIMIGGTNCASIVGGAEFRLSFDGGTNIRKFGIGTTGFFWQLMPLAYGTNTVILYGTNLPNISFASTAVVIRAGAPYVSILNQSVAAGATVATIIGTNSEYNYGIRVTNLSRAMGTYSDVPKSVDGRWSILMPMVAGSNIIAAYCTNIIGDAVGDTNAIVSKATIVNYGGQGYMCNTGAVGTAYIKVSFGVPTGTTLDTNATVIVPFVPTKVTITQITGDANTLFVSTSTNYTFYGWGVTTKGATNQFITSVMPKSLTNGKTLELDGPLTELYLKGSAVGTSYEIFSSSK
jgi:hypothetical protein